MTSSRCHAVLTFCRLYFALRRFQPPISPSPRITRLVKSRKISSSFSFSSLFLIFFFLSLNEKRFDTIRSERTDLTLSEKGKEEKLDFPPARFFLTTRFRKWFETLRSDRDSLSSARCSYLFMPSVPASFSVECNRECTGCLDGKRYESKLDEQVGKKLFPWDTFFSLPFSFSFQRVVEFKFVEETQFSRFINAKLKPLRASCPSFENN